MKGWTGLTALLFMTFVVCVGFGLASAATPAPEPTPVTVVDALGREVILAHPPTRIVAAGKATWMTAHALYMFPGAHERFLAMEKRGREQLSEFLTALYPDFADKPHLDADAGPEQIAPLKPDAVILKSYMKGRLGDSLEQLGLPVIYIDLETPEQYFRDIAVLGQLMDNTERAEEIVAYYRVRLDRIQSRLDAAATGEEADLTKGGLPRVLVLQYIERGGELAFDVPPAGWMQTIQVELAGGMPVWKDEAGGSGWQVVTFEQIAAWDADYVFVIVFRSDPQPVMERIRADARWQSLRAAREGHVYAFPADFFGWDSPDPRWILGLTWAAKTIHPELFADVDMTSEFYSFYEKLYGLSGPEVTEKVAPHVKGDVRIAHPLVKLRP